MLCSREGCSHFAEVQQGMYRQIVRYAMYETMSVDLISELVLWQVFVLDTRDRQPPGSRVTTIPAQLANIR